MIGPINRDIPFDAMAISVAVELAGAAAIAVNTDRKFFGCSYEDLTTVRVGVGQCLVEIVLSLFLRHVFIAGFQFVWAVVSRVVSHVCFHEFPPR